VNDIAKKEKINNRERLIFLSIFFSIFLVLFSCNSQESKWNGTIEEVDGVIVVKNPKESMYREEAFRLEEELFIGKSEGSEEYLLSQVSDLVVGENEDIYVLDFKESDIKVFNKDGKYIRTISGQGQGPGEIGVPRSLSLTSQNEIMVPDVRNRRLSFFSKEGEFIRSISTARINLRSTDIDSGGNIIGVVAFVKEDNLWHELRKFDSDMNYLFSFTSAPAPSPSHFNTYMPILRWSLNQNDQVLCGYPERYEVDIYDSRGKIIKKIMRNYMPVRISEEEKERLEKLPENINVIQRRHKSAYQGIMVDDQGRIFVQTWEQVTDQDGFYYDVFDPEGKYIFKVPLKTNPRIIKNNKLYTIEEDKQGYQYIKRCKIIWNY